MKNRLVFTAFLVSFFSLPLQGALIIDPMDEEFHSQVKTELDKMRSGERGIVCQALIQKLDNADVDTQIKPLTRDEDTWHPNDRKGLRSHVLPIDTKVRGSARLTPTAAIIYLHPSRINPKLSPFKLGTFAHNLAEARDLNEGSYVGDYRIREKRASFYRNAWRDSLGYPVLMKSGHVEIEEYALAKEEGLISIENAVMFPLVGEEIKRPIPTKSHLKISDLTRFSILPGECREGQIYYGEFEWGSAFLRVAEADEENIKLTFGSELNGTFEIFETNLSRNDSQKVFLITQEGIDYSKIMKKAKLVSSGHVNESTQWQKEIPKGESAVNIHALDN